MSISFFVFREILSHLSDFYIVSNLFGSVNPNLAIFYSKVELFSFTKKVIDIIVRSLAFHEVQTPKSFA